MQNKIVYYNFPYRKTCVYSTPLCFNASMVDVLTLWVPKPAYCTLCSSVKIFEICRFPSLETTWYKVHSYFWFRTENNFITSPRTKNRRWSALFKVFELCAHVAASLGVDGVDTSRANLVRLPTPTTHLQNNFPRTILWMHEQVSSRTFGFGIIKIYNTAATIKYRNVKGNATFLS